MSLTADIISYLDAGGTDIHDALVIEGSEKCDHGLCAHCYASCKPSGGSHMSQRMADKICRTLTQLGVRPNEIWIAGGEPTTNPRLPDLIETFAEVTPYVALVTNGFSLGSYEYARRLIAMPELKEIAITLNSGDAIVHNALVAPANAAMWGHCWGWEMAGLKKVGKPQSMYYTLASSTARGAYDKVMRAFSTIEIIRRELGRYDLVVAVNLNMSQDKDLPGLVNAITRCGGKLDKVIFQALNRNAGRADEMPNEHPLIRWQTPSELMVQTYFTAAKALLGEGRIQSAMCIDPLPDDIVVGAQLMDNPLYAAASTPAISVDGEIRPEVVVPAE